MVLASLLMVVFFVLGTMSFFPQTCLAQAKQCGSIDYNCVNIAHATQKDLQGKNLFDYKDTKGKYVIRELADAAKKGGGMVEYYWIKPGSKGELKKLGYVEPIPGTNYFIGTGVYLP